MNTQLKRFRDISKSIYTGYYTDLGQTDIIEESTLENIKITCIPYEGIHEKIKYTITIKFQEESMVKVNDYITENYSKINMVLRP